MKVNTPLNNLKIRLNRLEFYIDNKAADIAIENLTEHIKVMFDNLKGVYNPQLMKQLNERFDKSIFESKKIKDSLNMVV